MNWKKINTNVVVLTGLTIVFLIGLFNWFLNKNFDPIFYKGFRLLTGLGIASIFGMVFAIFISKRHQQLSKIWGLYLAFILLIIIIFSPLYFI